MAVKDLIVKLLVDDSDMGKLDGAAGKFDSFKTGLNRTSVVAAGVLGSMVAIGSSAMGDLQRIETLNTQTTAVIESTGSAAGVTASHVEEMAGALEGLTATEAEAIQEGANLLLTFTNVKNGVGEGNDIFDQATSVMTDMARAMGTDVASQATRVGKALNDPIAGIGALSKVGVQLTDDQKEMIKSMVEAGDVMGAQKVILGELNTQFGGSAESYADTMAGKQELIGHKFGETVEAITMALIPAFSDFLDIALEFASWASDNSDLLGVLVGVVGGLAAGVIVLNGVVTGFQAVQAIQTAAQWANNAAWLASPTTWIILAIVAAIGLLVAAGFLLVENWDSVVAWFGDAWEWISDVWGGFAGWWGDMWTGAGVVFEAVWRNIVSFITDWVVNPILYAVEFMVNGVISMINLMVDGINGVAGWTGLKIDHFAPVSIPKLATGGIVTSPTLALIGEAGPEAVIPLSGGAEYGVTGRGDTLEADVPVSINIDGHELARVLKRVQLREG